MVWVLERSTEPCACPDAGSEIKQNMDVLQARYWQNQNLPSVLETALWKRRHHDFIPLYQRYRKGVKLC